MDPISRQEQVRLQLFGYIRENGEIRYLKPSEIESLEQQFPVRREATAKLVFDPEAQRQSKIEQKIREEFGFEREKLGFERDDAGVEIVEPERLIKVEEEYREGLSAEVNHDINVLKREGIERKLQERQASLETAIRERLFGPKTEETRESISMNRQKYLEAEVRRKLFGSQETQTGSEIEEEPSIDAETRANIEALKKEALERKIRERFGSKTYEDEKEIIKCKYAPNKPCIILHPNR